MNGAAHTAACVLGMVGLVVAGPAGPVSAASADEVECGDTLTGDHRLTRDLVCDGTGLTFVGSTTLDLAGHTLDGEGSGVAFEAFPDPLEHEPPRVVVHDGVVRGWDHGILRSFAGEELHADIEAMTFDDVATVTRDEGGGASSNGLDVSMQDSTVTGSEVVFSTGWVSSVTVQRSRFEGSDVVFRGEDRATFVDCVFVDNARVAVAADHASLVLADSHVSGSTEVVAAGWAGATLTGSSFVDNDVVVAPSVSSRQVTDNTFEGNGLAVGVLAPRGGWGGWDGHTSVVGNAFRGNVDAIVAEPGSDLSLGDNVVTYGSGWGIYAPGAEDLSGNRAWGNAREPQCTGVVCLGRQS